MSPYHVFGIDIFLRALLYLVYDIQRMAGSGDQIVQKNGNAQEVKLSSD